MKSIRADIAPFTLAAAIAEAQLQVADPQRHPEFAGNVRTIDARPFWRDANISPKDQGYHYNHNAETYMLCGDALGRAMAELKGGKADPNKRRRRLVVGGAGHAWSGEGFALYLNGKLVSEAKEGYYKSGGSLRGALVAMTQSHRPLNR